MCVCVYVYVSLCDRTYVFCVRQANAVLDHLLAPFYLLDDACQFAGVLSHLLGEGADAVCHVQDGRTDLVSLCLQHCMLTKKKTPRLKEG